MRPALSSPGRLTFAALAATVLFLTPAARCLAYALEGETWPDGQIRMQLQLVSPSTPLGDGRASFNDSARDALITWNLYLQRVQFTAADAPAGFVPRADDGVNSVATANTVFGQAFGNGTLAVTLIDKDGTTLLGTDTLVNNRYVFDSYNGSLRRTNTGTIEDLHRVLLHEFGHVLGLNHPDQAGQNVVAIMNSRISDLDHLSDDDIAGAHYLYDASAANPSGGNSPGNFARIGAGKIQIDKVVYSPATGNLYAIGKKRGLGSKRLVTYDPYTLQVLASPEFPAPPDNLAVSGDGRYLYLTYPADGQERVRRLDLFTGVEDENFPLVAPASVPINTSIQVRDLQVAPGEADVLAVSEEYNPSSGRDAAAAASAVVVYDHGQPRANTFSSPLLFAPQLQFGGGPTVLFATPADSENVALQLLVDATGVTGQNQVFPRGQFYPSTQYIPGFVYNDGYLYSNSATQFALEAGNPAKQIGGLQFQSYYFVVDPVASRIFYLTQGFPNPQLSAYSLPDGKALGVVPLPAATGNLSYASFLAWGQRGLALGSPNTRGLYVARSVGFAGDPAAGGSPDLLTLQAPAVATIPQNSGQALKFRIRRDTSGGDSTQALTLHYTVSGTGVNGVNFRALSGTVNMPANSSQVKIKLVPQPDSLTNGAPAVVTLSLAADPSYRVAAPATATVSITPE